MMRFLTRRGVQMSFLMALLLMAAWFSGAERPWLQRLQYMTFDTFNQLAPRDPTQSVMVVDIDEESIAVLGQWPWPRDVIAKIPENLKKKGAASVAFDIVFAEPDRTSPKVIAERLPENESVDSVRRVLETLPDNDDVFVQSIKDAGNVVTGFVWSKHGNEGKIPVTRRGLILSKDARMMLMEKAASTEQIVTNLPMFEKAAAGNGSFSVSTDLDGIVRRVPLIIKFNTPDGKEILYPSLSLESLRVALGGRNSIQVRSAPSKSMKDLFKPALEARIGRLRVPMDKNGQIWIYYTPETAKRYIPAWRVIAGQITEEDVKGRIIMVGTSAEGLKDIRSSPLNLFVPGVEMHVNIIEQILQGRFISRPALANGIEAVFIFIMGLLVIILAPFVNPLILLGAVLTVIFGAFAISWEAYVAAGILIDPVYPSLAVMVLFVLSALMSYLKSEYERREIRGAFGLYISPDFMKDLTKNPEKLKLGGEIKPLTIMFTDIRNFTTISEGMTPEVLIHTMNDFLTPMSDEVMKARGTIDKYMGDAMMAFWNAPLDVEDHEKLAVRTALKMREVLAPVNAGLRIKAEEEGRTFFPLNCGIGINTGPVAVGNMGSKQRFAYSVLGDACNLASRLEGQTKTYGLTILMGEATANCANDFALMEIDYIQVKGRTEPERIYTVLGDEALAETENFKAWQNAHQEFLKSYRHCDFGQALELIHTCLEFDGSDVLGDYYMVFEMRARAFQKDPPPQDWDGVYTALSK